MTWRDELMEAMGDPEKLREVAKRAREYWKPTAVPKFDYKSLQAGERQPGEDEEAA
jgi:hypothetical protein